MASVTEETNQQLKQGMRICDCSNCRPEEAEALWLAQPALTSANFDEALSMDKASLIALVAALPAAAIPPRPEPRPVSFTCGKNDTIKSSKSLKALADRFYKNFTSFFRKVMIWPSNLGPDDYFGRDLAWDLVKNIDLFTQPSDFAAVLASESLVGQFDCLFSTFLQWKVDYDTHAAFTEAIARRKAAMRTTHTKTVQSVKGALLGKTRQDAKKKAKVAQRESQKQQVAMKKAACEALRSQVAKANVGSLAGSSQATLNAKTQAGRPSIAMLAQSAQRGHQTQSSAHSTAQAQTCPNVGKRTADDPPTMVDPKRQMSLNYCDLTAKYSPPDPEGARRNTYPGSLRRTSGTPAWLGWLLREGLTGKLSCDLIAI
ncbi:uncharacterized protein MELLADRAFT_113652 [Melampsora larici-populina 98AG31]|uniref:Uncharacterized protein n=1 Tax=Melampsora larici-populina (strain 98AG31 / pathotype 3-4-7) TaxID=747676 RepID=F4SAL4_MELLP|nr:uncharacterized protein MELLADRAFT_113652 [Melampsora larici-populina 98AG31]EGF98287.1 hypothetical protein MELLADRAFT_113652 [Melampsora larici-populina 98AG31]